MEDPAVGRAIERENAELSGRGRVLVRASGTEPLIRVMVEAPSSEETEQVCARLTEVVRTAVGSG
jgi:phosphoglucosamine mutase